MQAARSEYARDAFRSIRVAPYRADLEDEPWRPPRRRGRSSYALRAVHVRLLALDRLSRDVLGFVRLAEAVTPVCARAASPETKKRQEQITRALEAQTEIQPPSLEDSR